MPSAGHLAGPERISIAHTMKKGAQKLKNMDMKIAGNKLTITVDLSKTFGESGSGKSEIIASSEGNQSLPGKEDMKIGLNIYKPIK